MGGRRRPDQYGNQIAKTLLEVVADPCAKRVVFATLQLSGGESSVAALPKCSPSFVKATE